MAWVLGLFQRHAMDEEPSKGIHRHGEQPNSASRLSLSLVRVHDTLLGSLSTNSYLIPILQDFGLGRWISRIPGSPDY